MRRHIIYALKLLVPFYAPFYSYPPRYYIFGLSSFAYMQILFLLVFFFSCTCFAYSSMNWPLLLLAGYVSLVLYHFYRLFYMYSFPILRLLYFLMFSDTVANRFIVDGGHPCSRNFNSIASYVREMIYAMHSPRMCMHAWRDVGTKSIEDNVSPRLYLGFVDCMFV